MKLIEKLLQKGKFSTIKDIELKAFKFAKELIDSGKSSQWQSEHHAVITSSKLNHLPKYWDYIYNQYKYSLQEQTPPEEELHDCEHEWGPWLLMEEPTCYQDGDEYKVCAKCGEIQHRQIGKLEHMDCNGDGICQICGDNI